MAGGYGQANRPAMRGSGCVRLETVEDECRRSIDTVVHVECSLGLLRICLQSRHFDMRQTHESVWRNGEAFVFEMCGFPRQKANAYVLALANSSAALLTFEKPIRSGFPVDFVRIYLNMGDDESLDVFVTADSTVECGGDAKPANLSRFFCERCHASLQYPVSCQAAFLRVPGLAFLRLSGVVAGIFSTEAIVMFCSSSQCVRRRVRSSASAEYNSSPSAAVTRAHSSLILFSFRIRGPRTTSAML